MRKNILYFTILSALALAMSFASLRNASLAADIDDVREILLTRISDGKSEDLRSIAAGRPLQVVFATPT